MKKRILFINLAIVIFIITIINILETNYYQKEVIINKENNIIEENKSDMLSYLYETAYNSKEYKNNNDSPVDYYIFDSDLSKCQNNSKISWDEKKKV